MSSLQIALSKWDQKQAVYITDVYKRFNKEPAFVDDLLSFSIHPELERGGTWLIKHHLEQGGVLADNQLQQLATISPGLRHWEARLHALQVWAVVDIPLHLSEPVYAFAEVNRQHEKPFVRAWAFESLCKAAVVNAKFRKKVLDNSRLALETEMASVRSKLKKVISRLEKL